MTTALASLALVISGSAALSLIVKTTVVLLVGLAVIRTMRRTRASRRFAVLAWTFAALAVLPAVSAMVPAIQVVVRETRQVLVSTDAPSLSLPTAVRSHDVLSTTPLVESRPFDAHDWISTLVAALWATGFLVSLSPLLMTLVRLRSMRHTARPWHDVIRSVPVMVHEELAAPITFGWLRPVLLLPADSATWSTAELGCALVHELEHVRRRDWPVHVFARIVCATYWFNPLVWLAWRRLRLEADRACDDAVVRACEPRDFAEQLVALASRLDSSRRVPVLSMGGGDLVVRVKALLNAQQSRGPAGVFCSTAIAIGSISLALGVGTVAATEVTTIATVVEPRAATEVGPVPAAAQGPAVAEPSSPSTRSVPTPVSNRQTNAVKRFEAASLWRNTHDTMLGGRIVSPAGEAFVATNVSLETLIRWAYGLGALPLPALSSQAPHRWAALDLSSVPESLQQARFEVRGKAPTAPSEPAPGSLGEFHYMVQTLLAERFGLAVRWEPRDRVTYVLSLETPDQASDPALLDVVNGCLAESIGAPVACETRAVSGPSSSMRARVSMGGIARALEGVFQAEVIDRTGRAGVFDVDWVLNRADMPLLRDALRLRFGLRLEPAQATAEVLVVTRAEMPAD
jgi:uncharacterized protein (TIGR03435 family)